MELANSKIAKLCPNLTFVTSDSEPKTKSLHETIRSVFKFWPKKLIAISISCFACECICSDKALINQRAELPSKCLSVFLMHCCFSIPNKIQVLCEPTRYELLIRSYVSKMGQSSVFDVVRLN